MIAVTGITGQVGGHLARALLDNRQDVRAVVRDATKATPWVARGCDLALANMDDADALAYAFRDAHAVFVLLPPVFDPGPDMADARASVAALATALTAARPEHVVCLSTIGAQATQPNLLSALGLMEQTLGALALPTTFIRAAWFMENYQWDVGDARTQGRLSSHLQPLDRPVPMVATRDIAALAVRILMDKPPSATRVIQLEGPERYSPAQVADAFARLLGHPVRAEAIPREAWESAFTAQGMRNPLPRMQMLDGFNEGWIAFDGATVKGSTPIETVLQELVNAG